MPGDVWAFDKVDETQAYRATILSLYIFGEGSWKATLVDLETGKIKTHESQDWERKVRRNTLHFVEHHHVDNELVRCYCNS